MRSLSRVRKDSRRVTPLCSPDLRRTIRTLSPRCSPAVCRSVVLLLMAVGSDLPRLFFLQMSAPSVLSWDVLLHVVSVADAPALAALSAVSFDLLQSAGPRLYGIIDLRTHVQLERFQRKPNSVSSSPPAALPPCSFHPSSRVAADVSPL